ncbi:MAG: RNA-directed DNA polymerase [Alphaproteobacteria bacterium]|nr:RNA-directed DNA polymerase [Alphaproteobacteria bacterium]
MLLRSPWELYALWAALDEAFGRRMPFTRQLAMEALRVGRVGEERLARGLREGRAFRGLLRDEEPLRLVLWDLPVTQMQPPRVPLHWEPPELPTDDALAAWLGLELGPLRAFADLQDRARHHPPAWRNYQHRWIGRRLIEAPKARLKHVQRRVLHGILDALVVHPAAHGFVRGRDRRSHAAPHVGHEVVARVDLARFFPSIHRRRVTGLFEAMGYPRRVARLLAGLCAARTPPDVVEAGPADAPVRYDAPHLPQGAPTSPAVANALCWRLDQRLSARATASGHVYSRYADDLTISGPRRGMRALVAAVQVIAADEDFVVAADKTRVMHQSEQQRVTGIVVNAQPGVPRRERERLEAILVNCGRTDPAAQNRDGHPDFAAHLRGRVAAVGAVNARHGEKLLALWQAVDWG